MLRFDGESCSSFSLTDHFVFTHCSHTPNGLRPAPRSLWGRGLALRGCGAGADVASNCLHCAAHHPDPAPVVWAGVSYGRAHVGAGKTRSQPVPMLLRGRVRSPERSSRGTLCWAILLIKIGTTIWTFNSQSIHNCTTFVTFPNFLIFFVAMKI